MDTAYVADARTIGKSAENPNRAMPGYCMMVVMGSLERKSEDVADV